VLSSSIVCILPLTNTISGASSDGGRGRSPCFSSCFSSRALLSIELLAAAGAGPPWVNLRREEPRRFPLSEAISILLDQKKGRSVGRAVYDRACEQCAALLR